MWTTILQYIVPGILTFLALLFPALLRTIVFDVSTFIVKSIWKVWKRPLFRKNQVRASKKDQARIVQVLNPRTDRYIKIDREKGAIVSEKKTKGPYKGIPIVKK